MFQAATKFKNIPTRVVRRQDIVDEARKYLDVKFRHQGRNPRGVDCVGLVMLVAESFGYQCPMVSNYRREPRHEEFIGLFRHYMIEKPVKDRTKGDVILCRDHIFTCHSVIYDINGDEETAIHATARRRKVVEEPWDEELFGRATFCFEYVGVED